ncbi:hypothetical protein NFI96_003972, partial [Prochilodus magdalenae]
YHPNKPQYAVAINVPADKCGPEFKPDQNFLTAENPPDVVKQRLNAREVYLSHSMIGAIPKNFHSEYRLLNQPDQQNSPMRTLLNQNVQGCVIFYTYYSPCTKFCLSPGGDGLGSLRRNSRLGTGDVFGYRQSSANVWQQTSREADPHDWELAAVGTGTVMALGVLSHRWHSVQGWRLVYLVKDWISEVETSGEPPWWEKYYH